MDHLYEIVPGPQHLELIEGFLWNYFGHPDSRELQQSTLEVINAWTSFYISLYVDRVLVLGILSKSKQAVLQFNVGVEG